MSLVRHRVALSDPRQSLNSYLRTPGTLSRLLVVVAYTSSPASGSALVIRTCTRSLPPRPDGSCTFR